MLHDQLLRLIHSIVLTINREEDREALGELPLEVDVETRIHLADALHALHDDRGSGVLAHELQLSITKALLTISL